MKMNASDVLAALRVPGFGQWNVYQVGCVSSPLNFASQQQRAFKLTWALDQAKLIEGKKVAVVGAGLAGITAAATCCLRKAEKVTVYDRSHEIMSLQSGAIHRYVHPYIFWWPRDPEIPSPNWNDATTNFPILNWKEGNAHEIRNSVVKDSKELLNAYFKNNRLRYRMGCDVRRIVPIGDAKIELLAEGFESRPVPSRDNQYLPIGAIRNYQRSYDVVIVAVGFGLEAESAGIPFRSYWQQDTLDQPTIRGENPHRWLVTGTGEGGLTDAIRLTLFEVQQKEIAEVLLGRKSPTMNIPRDDWEKKWKRSVKTSL